MPMRKYTQQITRKRIPSRGYFEPLSALAWSRSTAGTTFIGVLRGLFRRISFTKAHVLARNSRRGASSVEESFRAMSLCLFGWESGKHKSRREAAPKAKKRRRRDASATDAERTNYLAVESEARLDLAATSVRSISSSV